MLCQEVSSIFGFAFIVGIGFLGNYFVHRLELTSLRVQDEVRKKEFNNNLHRVNFFTSFQTSYQDNNVGRFIAERAYNNLKSLNDFGNSYCLLLYFKWLVDSYT